MAKVVTIQKNYAFYTVEDHFAIVDGKEYGPFRTKEYAENFCEIHKHRENKTLWERICNWFKGK